MAYLRHLTHLRRLLDELNFCGKLSFSANPPWKPQPLSPISFGLAYFNST